MTGINAAHVQVSPVIARSSDTQRMKLELSWDRNLPRLRAEMARLVPLYPSEIHDLSIAGRLRIIALFNRAICGQHRLGTTAHWAYDLSRHRAIRQALFSEVVELEMLSNCVRRAHKLHSSVEE